MLTTATSYRLISTNLDRTLERTAKQPVISRESAYYLENIGNVRSIDDFLKNDRLFAFAMKAFGLQDMTYAKAFMRKALTEGADSDEAFVNKLSDTRYKEFVSTFNFALLGDKTTTFDSVKQGVVDKYVRQTLEEDAGAGNDGVRLALYFSRKASSITSVYQLLGDKALLQVTQTALGISPATSQADIDVQAAMIEKKLDIADLKDPEKLQKFMTRFTTMWDAANGVNMQANAAVTLLSGQPIEAGVSGDVLMSLQSLKLGGR